MIVPIPGKLFELFLAFLKDYWICGRNEIRKLHFGGHLKSTRLRLSLPFVVM